MKPVLGITMGDAAGIGAEIIVKSLADKHLYEIAQPVVIGDKKMMQRALDLLQSPLKINVVTNLDNLNTKYGTIDLVDLDNVPADLPYSQVDPRAGKAAYEYVEKAVQYAMANKVQAVVTAPLNKEALHAGGKMFPGHTEILAQLSGTKDYSMMLVSEKLRVIHVTTHVQLRKACDLVKKNGY